MSDSSLKAPNYLEWVSEGAPMPARKETVPLSVSTAFHDNDMFNTKEPAQNEGGPYAVKGAAHAHDRIEERTPLSKDNIAPLQHAIDTMGLPSGSYHLPLRGKDGQILGYAQFKGVPNRKSPVLATVLGPEMHPGGKNLEGYTKAADFVPENGVADNLKEDGPPERKHLISVGHEEPLDYAIRHGFDRATTPPTGETYE